MKVGFIGFGKSVHRYHLPFIDQIASIEVVGYYTRGNSVFEMPYPGSEQLTRFSTVEDLLAADVELIIVCTSAMHYQFAKSALLAGKHVLCEKPLCDTLAQAEELYELASARDLVLCPYQNRRFDSDYRGIFELIESGQVGTVAEIISNSTQDRLVATNVKSTKYNGMVYGHAVHFVDQIVAKYGQPDDLLYNIGNQRDYLFDGTGDVDDYYHILMIYPHIRVNINFNAICLAPPPRWVVYGSEATVEKKGIDRQEYYLKQGIYPDNEQFGIVPDDEQICVYTQHNPVQKHLVPIDTYAQFYIQLEQAINKVGAPPVSAEQAKAVINILQTIVENKKYTKLKEVN